MRIRDRYKAEVASILGSNTLANIKKKLLTKILMSSRELPTEWGVDSKRNVMQYATEQCKQKCGCSKVVCNQKRSSCRSLKFSWRFEDYYDPSIVKKSSHITHSFRRNITGELF